ncbi:NlpC/P60 family protein [Stomatohabitans albus]|uniref:NlpC/P60 family protein n=1 Tax=Stomatohabitans albus TaxID=3110766 RepID=UPI00300C98D5
MAIESSFIADPQVRRFAAIPAGSGRISKFGGPGDSMESSALMSIQPWPGNAPKSDWYCATQWTYAVQSARRGAKPRLAPGCTATLAGKAKMALRSQKVLVRSPKTGRAVVLWAADWGPATYLRRLIDVSPAALKALGISTDATVEVAWADPATPVGPVDPATMGEARPAVPSGETTQGPAPDETAPPPTASLVAGMGVYAPASIRLGVRDVHATTTVLAAQITRSISEPSALEIEVADPYGQARRHPTFLEASTSVLDGIAFTLQELDAGAQSLRVKLVDSVAVKLQGFKWVSENMVAQPGGTGTRGDFLRRVAHTVDPAMQVDIQPGQQAMVQLGVKSGETAWQTIRTVCDDVNWRAFVTANRLVCGADEWLLRRTQPIKVSKGTPGVHSISWRMIPGVIASEATIEADTLVWAAPPSQAVELSGEGPADGLWLVESVSRSLFSPRVQVSLTRKEPALAEPPPEPVNETPGSYDGPGKVDTAVQPRTGTSVDPEFVQVGAKMLGRMYDWGGTGTPGRGVDCSGLIVYALRPFGIRPPRVARDQLKWGRRIPIEQALATYGALVGRINPPGRKASGHIAISLGDGRILEAPSTGKPVRVTKWRKDLSIGVLVPGVTYG